MNQAIGLLLDIFGPAALVAGAVALAIVVLGRRLGSTSGVTWLLPVAVALGFFAGYLVLPRGSFPLLPEPPWREASPVWQWLPYLGILAAAVSGLSAWLPSKLVSRWLILCVTLILTGVVLTPSWSVFGLVRPATCVVAIVYLLVVSALVDCWPAKWLGADLIGVLALSAAVLALAVGAQVSVRFAQLTGTGAGAFVGCWLASWFGAKPSVEAIRQLSGIHAVLIGGVAFVACAEPDPPVVAMLAPPVVILLLWGSYKLAGTLIFTNRC